MNLIILLSRQQKTPENNDGKYVQGTRISFFNGSDSNE